MNWVPDEHAPAIAHRDGVPWHDAPLPWWWHRCRAQSRGRVYGDYFQRCACGRHGDEYGWLRGKNETRKGRRKAARTARLPDVTFTCITCGTPDTDKQGSPAVLTRQCTMCWSVDFLKRD